MKSISLLILSFAALSLTGCSQLSKKPALTGVEIDSQTKLEQESQLKKAEQVLEAQEFENAEKLFVEFQARNANSIYYQRAELGRAQALEGQERWSAAAELYRGVIQATRSSQPEIAALAYYRISFCYENLGDEARVQASLKDALKLEEYLLPEQAHAEIPARLAASFNRMGQPQLAEKYFKLADKGISQVRSSIDPKEQAAWLAKTYYQMGVFSTRQLDFENLQASLDTLKMVQIFSLRSAEAGALPWSQTAADELTENYQDLWSTIQKIPVNKSMEAGAAKREQIDRQVDLTGQMLALMNDLKMYRAPEGDDENPNLTGYVSELFIRLSQIEKQAQDFLHSLAERNPLTPEAEKRGGLKR